MKKITLVLFLIGNCTFAQLTSIPDPNFEQALIDLGYDDVIDGQVVTDNIDDIIVLEVNESGINDLTGIEDFTALEDLSCYINNLSTIDISNNLALKRIDIRENLPLTALDVSSNLNLEYILMSSPLISSVDLSNNPNLKEFYSRGENSNLTSVDVTNNPLLESLRVRSNSISELDLSNNPLLYIVECDDNLLTSLTVTNMPALQYLFCAKNMITSLDVSQNTNLEWFYCSENQISTLDLSENIILSQFGCDINQLTHLDVRNGNNSEIVDFNSSGNPQLTCIFVDDVNAPILLNWVIDPASTFVATEAECDALGIAEVGYHNFHLYPNPANTSFSIHSQVPINKVILHNSMGKLIAEYTEQKAYSLTGLSSGIYFVRVETDNGYMVKKLVVQ
jgi:hypothetical protein